MSPPAPRANGWLSIPDPLAALVFAAAGFDSVTLDMQHGLFDDAAAVRTLLALSGPQRLVRVAANDAAMIGRMLDAGADGVIVPLVNNAAEARLAAQAAFYPPAGRRSFGPVIAALRAGALPYTQAAAQVEIHAMIETRAGLEAAAEIAAVPGVAGLFVGPNDLALALGHGPGADREEPALIAALQTIVAAAHAHGKQAGLFCVSPGYARTIASLGFDWLTVASDTGVLAQGGANALRIFRE